ncbi:hypothetical protein DSO57_1004284 [Entomophthora muscae]|uniref:Uncharacterized protein n=1 Tax=Entomophthora muscae TaxID=34485 RepID=A0ACC2RZG0_9FUNG|nr:hypothetical protein DSO57_1004284 [Entomophthora muscae]
MKLTPAVLSSFVDTPLNEIKEIKLIEKGISHIDDISCCVNLHRLDLSKNVLQFHSQMAGIQYCEGLTWIKLAFNQIEEIAFLERFQNLITLNLSHNQLTRLTPHISNCKKLKALIINHNNFTTVENIGSLTELNSLILSHNKLSSPPQVHNLRFLTKLQLAHNVLREFPSVRLLENLKELSLNNNRITSIPSEIQYCPCLAILNLGHNFISRFEEIDILSRLLRLRELELKGNPISKEPNYEEKVKSILPRLKIFDNKRFDEKQKRKERDIKTEGSGHQVGFSNQTTKKSRPDGSFNQLQGASNGNVDTKSSFSNYAISGQNVV